MVVGCPSLEWSTLLWQGLRAQFNKPKFSDLKVNVQGEAVHVHRVVLATQSEALSQLLPMTEEVGLMNWSAHCNDINDAKDFLRSLYFGFGHIHQDNVLGLLKLAKIYNVKWLVEEAERFAMTHLNHSNVLEFVDFAIFYNCESLKDVCSNKLFKFNKKYSLTRVAQPLVKVWLHVTAKTLSYIISNDRLCVEDEVEVFQYVMCWIEAGQREITSPLALVRYGFLPSNFYALFALPYVMKVDPPLGTHLSESEISCPVFNADTLRKPSPGAMVKFRTPRTYRYFRNDPGLYKEAVIQISDDFLSKDKFKKSFPMADFTLNIDVDERVTISVDMPRSSSSHSCRGKKKTSPIILSNLDEENLMSEWATDQAKPEACSMENISSIDKHCSSKQSSGSDMISSEVSSPGPSTTSEEIPIVSIKTSSSNPHSNKPDREPDVGGTSSSNSGKDTLFYCYCLSPATRQPLALFRWWNTGGWHRTNFDMLIKQAHGTLALGVIVVR